MSTGKSVRDEKAYLAEYKRYVEQTVIYDKSYHIIICLMRDVTEEERERMDKEKISQQTIEMTDRDHRKAECAWRRENRLPCWARPLPKPRLR